MVVVAVVTLWVQFNGMAYLDSVQQHILAQCNVSHLLDLVRYIGLIRQGTPLYHDDD